MEYEGVIYYALLPKPENEDDEPEEFVVLKGEEDGDELLFSLDRLRGREPAHRGAFRLKGLFSMEEMDGGEDDILQ